MAVGSLQENKDAMWSLRNYEGILRNRRDTNKKDYYTKCKNTANVHGSTRTLLYACPLGAIKLFTLTIESNSLAFFPALQKA